MLLYVVFMGSTTKRCINAATCYFVGTSVGNSASCLRKQFYKHHINRTTVPKVLCKRVLTALEHSMHDLELSLTGTIALQLAVMLAICQQAGLLDFALTHLDLRGLAMPLDWTVRFLAPMLGPAGEQQGKLHA